MSGTYLPEHETELKLTLYALWYMKEITRQHFVEERIKVNFHHQDEDNKLTINDYTKKACKLLLATPLPVTFIPKNRCQNNPATIFQAGIEAKSHDSIQSPHL